MISKKELEEIRTCACLCRMAYNGEENFSGKAGYTFIQSGNMEAVILYGPSWLYPSRVYVAIRGTDSLDDFMMDIAFSKVPFGKGDDSLLIHKGFKDGAMKLADKIDSEISRLADGRLLDIIMTGHSLGGAVATILSAHTITGTNQMVKKLVTFGSPRVGNDNFADYINSLPGLEVCRIVNNNDIVPRLPPGKFSYKHCKGLLYITSNGKVLSDVTPWVKFQDRIKGYFGSFLGKFGGDLHVDPVKDHFISNYIEQLKEK